MFLVNTKKCLRIFEDVYVSSDSPWILEQAEVEGAKPILRKEDLCGDTPNIPVYRHAVEQMGDVDGIIAVQSNSPSINPNIISHIKHMMEYGADEVMTCDENYQIYGSVWAITKDKLKNYEDPYNPKPSILVVDKSVDIHTEKDLEKALCQ